MSATHSPTGSRLVLWRGLDVWRTEAALIWLSDNGIEAEGTQIGIDPLPYRLQYRLDASQGFRTRRLTLTAAGDGWHRHLDLRRSESGQWTADAGADGTVDLPDPGGDTASLAGALDCDLGFSPLTNLMPVRRSALHQNPGSSDFVMAWVAVPDLTVVAAAQRYVHVRSDEHGSVVRYEDLELFAGFEAELHLDNSGLVVRYPDLAERA